MGDDAHTPARDRRRLSWRAGLLLALVLTALGAEAAVRVVDWRAGRSAGFYLPPDPAKKLYAPHPYLGFVLVPGKHEARQHPVTVNALGMRGREMARHKPPGTYRIFCLGGSTTYGTGASGDDATYPARLEQSLNATAAELGLTQHYEVGNCGVVDWNSADNLINLELRLLDDEPDAIVYYEAANDGRVAQLEGFVSDFSHARRPWPTVDVPPLECFLLANVRTFAWLTRGTDPHDQYANVDSSTFKPGIFERRIESSDAVNEEGVATYIRNLSSILAVAREHGIQAVLSTFAMRSPAMRGKGDQQPEFIHRANDALRELARAKSVPLVDVDKALSGQDELFVDFMHFNDRGERRHADVLLNQARAQRLFGLRPAR